MLLSGHKKNVLFGMLLHVSVIKWSLEKGFVSKGYEVDIRERLSW